MSEIMIPIPFDKLIDWMTTEYERSGSVFGIKDGQFYRGETKAIEMFGSRLANPVGPAAGPHTQLAQNLVAAYAAGFRFMELKTVQTLDGEELRKQIPRPCINARDEGYNCEWSTELTVAQAFEEYVKGWFAVHVAAKEFGIADEPGVLFNMSVGYDYAGITSEKIDAFIEGLKDAHKTQIWQDCTDYLKKNIDRFSRFTLDDLEQISPNISASITLSTLHGCPPEEIEKIAHYFLVEKKLHTYIKCNPTLLDFDYAREVLRFMGYGYVQFDRHHFDHDLQFDDATALLSRLTETAKKAGLQLGVKVSNTFPVAVADAELPSEQMYMSGRALYALSVSVAAKLASFFDGKLPISFSGGADHFNITKLLDAGIRPITVATTILKPGGYARARQLCEDAQMAVRSIPEQIDVALLKQIAKQAPTDPHLIKQARETASRKTGSKLPLFDCFKAPCSSGGCPIEQQVPLYLKLVSESRLEEAFEVIAIDNAMPGTTGEICDHACQGKCVRMDYEKPLRIRDAKRLAAEHAQQKHIDATIPCALRTDKKAVVIGAGPAGVAAGLFLRRNGMDVTVLEKREEPMGIVRYIIPGFRISRQAMDRDVGMAKAAGVKFQFGVDENYDIKKLRETYDFVIIATGAWKEGRCPVETGGDQITDALDFLLESKEKDCAMDLGRRVAVIGGGDVAMDCARAAKRAPGVEEVCIVYRRTRAYMPSEPEQQNLALGDDVKFIELKSPVSYDGKTLVVDRMTLAEKGADGRRKTKPIGQREEMFFDTVISATGARVDTAQMAQNGIAMTDCGFANTGDNYETVLEGVYTAGDCRAGADTVVRAVADSKRIAIDILGKCGLSHDFERLETGLQKQVLESRRGILRDAQRGASDGERCLSCADVCEICCEVCPNRANVSIMAEGRPQIVHIDGMCNECGNCEVFCPHTGDPSKDKLTLFWTHEAFEDSENCGWLNLPGHRVLVRDSKGCVFESSIGADAIEKTMRAVILQMFEQHRYMMVTGENGGTV